MAGPQLTPDQMTLLNGLKTKLGTDEATALLKALHIADTDADPDSKLIIEQRGKFTQLHLVRN